MMGTVYRTLTSEGWQYHQKGEFKKEEQKLLEGKKIVYKKIKTKGGQND
jgi:hypothetical protein